MRDLRYELRKEKSKIAMTFNAETCKNPNLLKKLVDSLSSNTKIVVTGYTKEYVEFYAKTSEDAFLVNKFLDENRVLVVYTDSEILDFCVKERIALITSSKKLEREAIKRKIPVRLLT